MVERARDVTSLIEDLKGGNPAAWPALWTVVYDELRHLAQRELRGENPGHTLQATALVNELYLQFNCQREIPWKDRSHFFCAAAKAMEHILIDHARRRDSEKRGGGRLNVSLHSLRDIGEEITSPSDPEDNLEGISQTLDWLEKHESHRLKVAIVRLRFFVGMTLEETAKALDISIDRVKRDWRFTKALILERATQR